MGVSAFSRLSPHLHFSPLPWQRMSPSVLCGTQIGKLSPLLFFSHLYSSRMEVDPTDDGEDRVPGEQKVEDTDNHEVWLCHLRRWWDSDDYLPVLYRLARYSHKLIYGVCVRFRKLRLRLAELPLPEQSVTLSRWRWIYTTLVCTWLSSLEILFQLKL